MPTKHRNATGSRRPAGRRRSRGIPRRKLLLRRGRATVWFEAGGLTRREAEEFAALVSRGIRDVERLLGRTTRTRLRFEVRSDVQISAARGRTIRLPLHRVRAGSAPYLHEIVHALVPCPDAPGWFSEGLACYAESAVSEHFGGYDSRLFTPDGNRGVDSDAARWLADPRGRSVLRFVGTRGQPRGMLRDRHNVAAPLYVLSHSLVKFLAEEAGIPTLVRLARTRRFAAELHRATGTTAAGWREEWLRFLMLGDLRYVGKCTEVVGTGAYSPNNRRMPGG